MPTARYSAARWAMLAAHARLDVTHAILEGRSPAVAEAWLAVCELRRDYYAEEWAKGYARAPCR